MRQFPESCSETDFCSSPLHSKRRNSHSWWWRGQASCNNTQSSRWKHSYMAHSPAAYKDSPPPSLDSWLSWSLGAQSFSQEDTGVWERVRRMPCAVHSTQPGGWARGDSQPGCWNPIWQLAFSFLFTCCINFVAIFAFWGSLHNLSWCNKTQVTCRF